MQRHKGSSPVRHSPWAAGALAVAMGLMVGCPATTPDSPTPQTPATPTTQSTLTTPPSPAPSEPADDVADSTPTEGALAPNSTASTPSGDPGRPDSLTADAPSVDLPPPADAPPADAAPAVEPAVLPSPPAAASGTGPSKGPLFEGWPKPRMVFMLTGRMKGYLEPCGCTGLENQKGGLARRHVFLQSLLEREWKVAPLDVGSQVKRYGAQAELKFQMSVEALNKMGYLGVAFGAEDLRLSVDALISASVDDSPFMCANASVLDLSATHRIVELGGRKIGVTAVLGELDQRRITSDEVEIKSIDAGLGPVLEKMRAAKCDYVVVLAHATLDESRAMVGKYPQIDLIVTAGGAEEPAYVPEKFANSKTRLVQVGAKGMYAGVLGLFDDQDRPVRFQRVPLDDRFADSKEMLRLLKTYQAKLKTLGLAKLGIRPLSHPTGRKFVGSSECADCHSIAYEVWEKTPHAEAIHSIKTPPQRSDIARHHDPECLSCHVTGWNPSKFTPYISGYLDFAKSMALHGNGCENCHGPGDQHVAAESGDESVDDKELSIRRVQMRLTMEDAEKKCLECHDLDNSPDFHGPGAFGKYWKDVEHKGID